MVTSARFCSRTESPTVAAICMEAEAFRIGRITRNWTIRPTRKRSATTKMLDL